MPGQLPALPSIRYLLDVYGAKSASRLGQNFLLDRNITGG
jgi:hypothetical protein